MTTLNELLKKKGITLAEVRAHLDGLTPEQRVTESTQLSRSVQKTLWNLAEKGEPLAFEDLVPSAVGELTPVPFEGQNNQPLFRGFQKVFFRAKDGSIGGRNVSPVSPVGGDGYYVVRKDDEGLYVDYFSVPTEAPAGWPSIASNDHGLRSLFYGYMKDYLRRVHGKILIGEARKKSMGVMGYFVLARPD